MFESSKDYQKAKTNLTANSQMTTLEASNYFSDFSLLRENPFASTISFNPSKEFFKYASRPPLPKKTPKNSKNTCEKIVTTYICEEREVKNINGKENKPISLEKQAKQFSLADSEFESFDLSKEKLKKLNKDKNFVGILNSNVKQIEQKENKNPMNKISVNNILIEEYQNSDFFNEKKQQKRNHENFKIDKRVTNHDHIKSGGICFDIDLAQFTNNKFSKSEESRKTPKINRGSLREEILIGKKNAKEYDKRTKALIFGNFREVSN